jgi:hypothetical protein
MSAAARFPRVEAVIEAERVADALRAGAARLDAIGREAPNFELGTLRRLIRAAVLETIHEAIEAEGVGS